MIHLSIFTPIFHLFKVSCYCVTVPGRDGVLTVLPNHESMVVLLSSGILSVKQHEKSEEFIITGGMMHINKAGVNILVFDFVTKDLITGEKLKEVEGRLKSISNLSGASTFQYSDFAKLIRNRVSEDFTTSI
jgi:F-type H+-transporting ATPase subunit epsilon